MYLCCNFLYKVLFSTVMYGTEQSQIYTWLKMTARKMKVEFSVKCYNHEETSCSVKGYLKGPGFVFENFTITFNLGKGKS